jgi:hypothetical protein
MDRRIDKISVVAMIERTKTRARKPKAPLGMEPFPRRIRQSVSIASPRRYAYPQLVPASTRSRKSVPSRPNQPPSL